MMIFHMTHAHPLIGALLERREDLRRYFAARVGDADADDLVQETYLRAAAVPDDAEVRSPGAYLYRLGANVMLDRLRQQRARGNRDGDWREAMVSSTASGEDMDDSAPADRALIARDRLRRLRDALGELPESVQRTFHLHKVEGLSHAEVAARLGVSRSLVEKHMMRALKHLLAVPE
jgi:RNA polymerase sigma-70 factor (ECF subfamily)